MDFESLKQLIHSHRSIRKFKPDSIDEALLNEILECGIRASSSGNMQSWSVVVTEDEKIKESLYHAHMSQEMILQAPLILTFCSDFNRIRNWVDLHNSKQSFDDFFGFLIGALDAVLASQNITLACESNGLGICYLGSTLAGADKISEILALPRHVMPVTSIVVGVPDENPKTRMRLPMKAVVHKDKYRSMDDEELKAVYKEFENAAWERYNSNPAIAENIRKLDIHSVSDYYTSEIKYSKNLHEQVSQMLLKLLKEKNFY